MNNLKQGLFEDKDLVLRSRLELGLGKGVSWNGYGYGREGAR